jgi:hypothetical protein
VNNDGSEVFFDSPDPLVAQATNGLRNVYEYEDGSVHLLSDGNGQYQSLLLGASKDGSDVIIETADSLVTQDQNNGQGDLYDVRVDGGFRRPAPPTGCEADACQGPLSAAPVLPSAVSAVLPAENGASAPVPNATRTAAQIRAQQLTRALKTCRSYQNRKKRVGCERQARKRYDLRQTTRARKSRRSRRSIGGSP